MKSIKTISSKLKLVLNLFGLEIIRKRERNFDKIVIQLFTILGYLPRIVVDVGAHNGSSIRSFRRLFDNPSIYAFEANPNLFVNLQSDFKDSNIHLNQQALGRSKGVTSFNIHTTSTGSSSLLDINPRLKFANRRNINEETVERVQVEVNTLDDIFYSDSFDGIGYLKIDTQGTEVDVLFGASKLLSKQLIDVIEFEIITVNAYKNMNKWSDTIAFLLEFDYNLLALSNDSRFFNLGPFDIIQNPELQFDCIFVNTKIYNALSKV